MGIAFIFLGVRANNTKCALLNHPVQLAFYVLSAHLGVAQGCFYVVVGR
jgi:hypothetical protein